MSLISQRSDSNNLNLSKLWCTSPTLVPDSRLSSFLRMCIISHPNNSSACWLFSTQCDDEKLKQRKVGKWQQHNSWAQFQQPKVFFMLNSRVLHLRDVGRQAFLPQEVGLLGLRHWASSGQWTWVDGWTWQGTRHSGSEAFYLVLWHFPVTGHRHQLNGKESLKGMRVCEKSFNARD